MKPWNLGLFQELVSYPELDTVWITQPGAALGTGETLTVWNPTSAGGNSHPAILGGLLYLERWLIFFEWAM